MEDIDLLDYDKLQEEKVQYDSSERINYGFDDGLYAGDDMLGFNDFFI
jgi:hypothetical protein